MPPRRGSEFPWTPVPTWPASPGVLPDRPLTPEYERILAVGSLSGADLWHLACALFVAQNPGDLSFITLDRRQLDVAGRLGFA